MQRFSSLKAAFVNNGRKLVVQLIVLPSSLIRSFAICESKRDFRDSPQLTSALTSAANQSSQLEPTGMAPWARLHSQSQTTNLFKWNLNSSLPTLVVDNASFIDQLQIQVFLFFVVAGCLRVFQMPRAGSWNSELKSVVELTVYVLLA